MRILIATDAWHPQVNGVVRTLTSLARAAATLGTEIAFLTPEGFPSFQVPTYPGLRLAITNRREIARRIEAAAPDAIHIATEGTIGWAVRQGYEALDATIRRADRALYAERAAVRGGASAGSISNAPDDR